MRVEFHVNWPNGRASFEREIELADFQEAAAISDLRDRVRFLRAKTGDPRFQGADIVMLPKREAK